MGAYSKAIKDGFKSQISQLTATTSPQTINTVPGAKAMHLFNRNDSRALLYSLDNGTTYLQVPALGEVDENIEATKILIKSVSSTVAFDLKVALRQ